MKAISLWQPWASAIALGHKTIETRHWSTKHRGWLAIHAAKRWGPHERQFAATEHALGRLPARLPLGAIVAVAVLSFVRPTEEAETTAIERIYGDFSPGRFAWVLMDVHALKDPVGCRGRQSFWTLEPDVEEAVMSQVRRDG